VPLCLVNENMQMGGIAGEPVDRERDDHLGLATPDRVAHRRQLRALP